MTTAIFLSERFPPDIGGVACSAGRIATALSKLGINIIVVTWSRFLPPGELSPVEVLEGGVTVYRVGMYRHWDMTLPQTLNILDWLLQQQTPAGSVFLWGHYLFPAGFLAVYFAQLNGLVSIVSARGNDIDRLMFPPGDFARLQWTLQHASAITAVSQDMVQKISVLSGQKAKLHKNVVDTDIFCPVSSGPTQEILKQSLGIPLDAIVLGFAGELREKKGQQYLLQALLDVRAVRPACLLIVGELRDRAILQNFLAQHPTAQVVVTGHLDTPQQVAQHYQLCDIYLQPSLWDGAPNALLEAMACGCLCLASDAGGIPDLLMSGQQGYLLPRSQLQNLGTAALDLLSLSAGRQQEIRNAARSHICHHHTLAREYTFLEGLLAEVLPVGRE